MDYSSTIGKKIRVAIPLFSAFVGLISLFSAVADAQVQSQSPILRPAGLTQDQVLDGWIALFDGETLMGWKPVTRANWSVQQGEIRVSGGERGLLRTTSQFDDFEMVLEFKASPQTNSGVFIRTSPQPQDVLQDCYELNIAPQGHPFPTGAIVGRAKTQLAPTADNRWQQMRVLADGNKVKVWINDEKASELLDQRPLGRGYIGLQFNSGSIAFRNIAIKPLNQQALFDGQSLDAWNTDQQMASTFRINAQQELEVTGGRGQLESKATFGDCIISLACKTNAAQLNSGLFFRCLPGELMNGYESQIQNGTHDGDRSKPVDCGTGGIFRRVNARRVNADDQSWFAKTVIAVGPHVSVWVNGYQVTDWTDRRKPDPNPRKGYRAAAGTLILQGHDPTTDLLFRNILARELSPRRGKQ